jgi:hypothetical protein
MTRTKKIKIDLEVVNIMELELKENQINCILQHTQHTVFNIKYCNIPYFYIKEPFFKLDDNKDGFISYRDWKQSIKADSKIYFHYNFSPKLNILH